MSKTYSHSSPTQLRKTFCLHFEPSDLFEILWNPCETNLQFPKIHKHFDYGSAHAIVSIIYQSLELYEKSEFGFIWYDFFKILSVQEDILSAFWILRSIRDPLESLWNKLTMFKNSQTFCLCLSTQYCLNNLSESGIIWKIRIWLHRAFFAHRISSECRKHILIATLLGSGRPFVCILNPRIYSRSFGIPVKQT